MKISKRVQELFPYIPTAIIPALVAAVVFFHHGSVTWLAGRKGFDPRANHCGLRAFEEYIDYPFLFGLLSLYCVRGLQNGFFHFRRRTLWIDYYSFEVRWPHQCRNQASIFETFDCKTDGGCKF